MKMTKLATIGLIILIFCQAIPASVEGDGIPIVKVDTHAVLRENSQIAYIEVLNDSLEQLELFINVVSLHPGENMTIVVPLRTMPLSMNVTESTDKKFMISHDFEYLKELGRIQNNNAGHIVDTLKSEEGTAMIAFVLMGGIGLVLTTWSLSFGGGGWGGDYNTPGFSVELRNFSSQESLEEFYKNLNLSLPDNVEEIMDRYSDYGIALINLTTRPPIPVEDYSNLTAHFPETMENFSRFVKEHPTITVRERVSPDGFLYGVYDEDLTAIYRDFLKSLDHFIKTNHDENVDRQQYIRNFNHLVAVTYGYGEMEGYALSLTLPLFQGKAFFPLGTTPAWSGTDRIEVIFQCDDEHTIEMNRDPDYEVIKDGGHYFIYSQRDDIPDYDLEGKYEKSDNAWAQKRFAFNGWIHGNRFPLTFLLILTFCYLICLGISYLVVRSKDKNAGWKPIACLALAGIMGFIFLGILYSMGLAIFLFNNHRDKKLSQKRYLEPVTKNGFRYGPGKQNLRYNPIIRPVSKNDNLDISAMDRAIYILTQFSSVVGAIFLVATFFLFLNALTSSNTHEVTIIFYGLGFLGVIIIVALSVRTLFRIHYKGYSRM